MSTSTEGRPTATAGQPVIHAEDVRIWYGTNRGPVKAVDGVSFELRKGEILGLVGESGCGKSTLGRGMLGLLPEGAKMDGRLDFRGEDLLSIPRKQMLAKRGAELGMIFQEPLTRLNPLMRISDHFKETLQTHEPGLSKNEIRDRSLDVLRRMGIPPTRFRSYPHEFSGGMRQRLMIALALVLRPDFVVADEPTTALDVLVEAQIIQILHDLRREPVHAHHLHGGGQLALHELRIIGVHRPHCARVHGRDAERYDAQHQQHGHHLRDDPGVLEQLLHLLFPMRRFSRDKRPRLPL